MGVNVYEYYASLPERLIALVMALYTNARSRVRTLAGTSDEFGIGVGIHQGSSWGTLVFGDVRGREKGDSIR